MVNLVRFALIGCFVLVGACNRSQDSGGEALLAPGPGERAEERPSEPPAVPKPRVALVMKTRANPFFVAMESGARRAEAEHGVELVVRTHGDETAVQEQIAIVEKLIDEDIDAIVLVPGNSSELVPVVKRAQDAGVVIVNIDNRLDPDAAAAWKLAPIPFVGVDNTRGAKAVAEHLVSQLKRPAKVAIISGDPAAYSSLERERGAREVFASHDDIELVAHEAGNWNIKLAHEVAGRFIAQHPDLAGIFCANDVMALGAVRQLEERGRGDILVAGYDNLDSARDAIKRGAMLATVDQNAGEQGYLGVTYAARILADESVPPETMVDVVVVTAASLEHDAQRSR